MDNINTDIGKIYCRYEEEKDDFYKIRLVKIDESKYIFHEMDENYKILDEEIVYTEEEYNDIKRSYTLLRSDGIISLTNVVAIKNETKEIKDIVMIFFPNNKNTRVPDITQPFVVARQGLNNIFDPTGDSVGLSVSIVTVPSNYALVDFMENDSVISSQLMHLYKVDSSYNISKILGNEDTDTIIKDLFDHEVHYLENTVNGFEEKFKENPDEYTCLHGYNSTFRGFLDNSGFINDIYSIMNISKVDFEMKSNNPLNDEDKILLVAIYATRINKAVPLKFDYDINLRAIRMKYFMVKDINDVLFIVPYTVFPDEFDAASMYKLTEEQTLQLQDRLRKCVQAYSKN